MKKKSELNKELYTPAEVAKELGITTRTLFTWGDNGKVKFEETKKDGKVTRRMYSKESFISLLKETNQLLEDDNRYDVIYARVSTAKQNKSGDLERQINKIKLFAIDFNPQNIKVFSDVASGLNDDRKNLNQLLLKVQNNEVNRIFISHKDRLTRFGYGYLKNIFSKYNCEIIEINDTIEKTFQEELTEDLIAIIHHFSMKFYGSRKNTIKKLIEIIK